MGIYHIGKSLTHECLNGHQEAQILCEMILTLLFFSPLQTQARSD